MVTQYSDFGKKLKLHIYIYTAQQDPTYWIPTIHCLPNEDEIPYTTFIDTSPRDRRVSDQVLARDKDQNIYLGYFMSTAYERPYDGQCFKNEYTLLHSKTCTAGWEFCTHPQGWGDRYDVIEWRPLNVS